MCNILEVDNTHGGNFDYVLSLIDEFKEFKKNKSDWINDK